MDNQHEGSETPIPGEVKLDWDKYRTVFRRMRDTLATCWRFSKEHRRDLAFGFTATLAIEACGVLAPWMAAKLMVRVSQHPRDFQWSEVGGILAMLWLCWLSWGLLDGVRAMFNQRFDNELGRDLPVRVLRHLLSLSRSFHQANNASELTANVVRGVNGVKRVVDLLQYNLLPRTLTLLLVVILLGYLDIGFLVIGLSVLVSYSFVVIRGRAQTQALYDTATKLEQEADGFAGEVYANALVAQAFHQEDAVAKKLFAIRDLQRECKRREAAIGLRVRTVLAFISDQAGWLMLVYALYLLKTGQMSFQTLMFAASLINRFRDEIVHLGWMYESAVAVMGGIEVFDGLLGMLPTVIDPPNPKPLPDVGAAEIVFDNASFAYPTDKGVPGTVLALQDIDLRIGPGQVLGVTGESGGGKSSLIGLLLRFADPTAGRVLFNGIDLRDAAMGDLRGRIGYVEQFVQLFNDTVRNNIDFGRGCTQEEIEEAAKDAGAHAFIMALPNGYDTLIGDRGTRISGGQRQRLGIARAIAKRPSVLVLDEATNSLDAKSIVPVFEAFKRVKAKGECTMIVITHQLAVIQDLADLIVIIRKGKIAETGTHAQLLKRNGLYRELMEIQQLFDRQRDAEAV